ncbi:MAG: glycoside hydrolase family 38 C-terminal domain-containing protein [Cyanobacteriota bacterium]
MSKQTKVYVYIHTHWDREWYRTFQQYRLRLIEVIDLILDQFEKKELEYFTLDGQSIVIEDYLEVKPQNKEKLINYIKSGQLDIGPWMVLPDEFLVSGESLINNIILGHKISEKYGKTNKIGYIPDTFGHSIDMPMIFKQFNIDNSIMWRGVNTDNTEFNWYSMDRSYVKSYHIMKGYYTNIFEEEENYDLENKVKLLKEFLDEIKEKTTLDSILLPVGGDHRPPPINISSQLKLLNNAQTEYLFIQSNLSQFINNINSKNINEHVQKELRDCSKTYILPAVYSSRLYLKQYNAQLNNKINRIIEPLTCYCNSFKLDTFQLPDSDYLWKMLIINQPHDSICGCSIDEVHEEMVQRYDCLEQACNELINRSLFTLIKNIPEEKIAVFNSSNYPYTGPIEFTQINDTNHNLNTQIIEEFKDRHYRYYNDLKIQLPATIVKHQVNQLLWADNIPPYSVKIIDSIDIPNPVKIENNNLNNGLVELIIEEDSVKLKDLKNNCEYAGLNQIIHRLDSGDSYNFGPIKDNNPVKAKIIESNIVEDGPIKGTIEVLYEIEIPEKLNEDRQTPSTDTAKILFICDISLYANSKLLEFNIDWLNEAEDHILQVKFPTDNDVYSTLVENHFCALERSFDPNYNIYNHIPAEKLTEVATNTAPMQRFVQANNLAIFTEGLPEYEVFENNLYVTILRATGYLSRDFVSTRGAYAGPDLQVPGNQCMGFNSARYAIHPKVPLDNLYMLAERFMGCTQVFEGESTNTCSDKSLISWNNPNIIASTLKYDLCTGGIILRLLNLSSHPQQIKLSSDLNINTITEINALKEILSEPTENTTILLGPNELKGLLIKTI